MSSWWLFGFGAGMVVVVFFAAWLWARRIDHYSMVDAVWAFGIGLTAVTWLGFSSWDAKQWVVAALVGLWSLRLTWHLQRRIRRHYPEEDSRYVKLREVWCGRVPSAFFWFFIAQAVSVVLLALPFWVVASDADGVWGFWEIAGVMVCVSGIVGEAMADGQMAGFKSRNEDPRAVCQDGMWRYSRHPNYFFEGVIWVGFYLYACGSDWGWATIHAPAMIIYLLLRVTGIPPTEAAAVLRKGDAYRRYQKTTSAFFPWPPRRES